MKARKIVALISAILIASMSITACSENIDDTAMTENSSASNNNSIDDQLLTIKSCISENIDYSLYDIEIDEKYGGIYEIHASLDDSHDLSGFPDFIDDLVNATSEAINQSRLQIDYYISASVFANRSMSFYCWISSDGTYNLECQGYSLATNLTSSELKDEIKRCKKLLQYIDSLQGEWKIIGQDDGDACWHIIINGIEMNYLYYEKYGDKVEESNHNIYYLLLDDEGNLIAKELYSLQDREYSVKLDQSGRMIIERINSDLYHTKNIYAKVSDRTELPQIYKKETEDPKVGMTESEVYASTWGSPKKRNKTTTTYGTREQWVYNDGYIYFENGIVVAIQE